MTTSWQYLAAVINRIGGKEINITHEDLEAVKDCVVMSEYHAGKVTLRIGLPEAWPDDERRMDVIGQNGNTGLHYEGAENEK